MSCGTWAGGRLPTNGGEEGEAYTRVYHPGCTRRHITRDIPPPGEAEGRFYPVLPSQERQKGEVLSCFTHPQEAERGGFTLFYPPPGRHIGEVLPCFTHPWEAGRVFYPVLPTQGCITGCTYRGTSGCITVVYIPRCTSGCERYLPGYTSGCERHLPGYTSGV